MELIFIIGFIILAILLYFNLASTIKKICYLILFLFILFVLGCGNNYKYKDTAPSGITGLFSSYIEDGNYEAAKEFLTDDAKKMYSFDLEMMNEVFAKRPGSVVNNYERGNIGVDTATIPVYWTDLQEHKEYTLDLIKDEEGWKINGITKNY